MQSIEFTKAGAPMAPRSPACPRQIPRRKGRIRAAISADSAPEYDRSRDLPSLLALWPWEIENLSLETHTRLVGKLRRALRLERQRAVAGHWTYDLARHARLLAAYRSEAASLEARLGRDDERPRL